MMVVPIVIPGGGGSTGEPVIVANFAARPTGAAAGTIIQSGSPETNDITLWYAFGGDSWVRILTPAISHGFDVPVADAEHEIFSCTLQCYGVGFAFGTGTTWTVSQITETQPFDVTDWIAGGLVFPQGTPMYNGSATRWAFDGNGPSWARTTTLGVATLAELPAPGDYETFADADVVFPALSCVCAETGFNYVWSGVAWTLP